MIRRVGWRVFLLGVAIVVAGAVVFATHEGSTESSLSSATPVVTQPNIAPQTAGPSSCTVMLYGQDAVVSFSSPTADVAPLCREWIRTSARAGELWQSDPGASTAPVVCRLSSGSVSAVIQDDGQQDFGQQTCESLLGDGWNAS